MIVSFGQAKKHGSMQRPSVTGSTLKRITATPIFQDFKRFLLRGNVIDLAVGIMIGAAFGKIVTSLIADVLMPPLGLLIGNVDFKDLKIVIGGSETEPVTLNYGLFIQNVFEFLIIAFALFLIIRFSERLKRLSAQSEAAPSVPSDIQLLTEIRDLLKGESGSGKKGGRRE